MRLLFFVFAFLSALCGDAQVNFENVSLVEAISRSAASGKLVFAQFVSEHCENCNAIADRSFAVKALGETVNSKCIAIKIEVNSSDRDQFINAYNFEEVSGTFFISGEGQLVHKYTPTTGGYAEYIAQVNKAFTKATGRKAILKELDDQWNSDKSVLASEANIRKRASLSLPVDSLLEYYISRLPSDSLVSVRVLQFIALQAPSLFSNANSRLKLHHDLFLKIWYNWPRELRKQLNNSIIYKSMQEAIKERRADKARDVAAYAVGTYPEFVGAHTKQKAYDQQMLAYYVGIKNEQEYVSKALAYYDKYYFSLPIYQYEERESAVGTIAKNAAKEDTIWDANSGKYKIRKKVSKSHRSPYYSSEIAYLATLIYTSTNDVQYLNKALDMAANANELYETSSTMDTYAKILYKLGKKEDAISWEQKAINFNRAKRISSAYNERVLASMKNGTLK